MEGLVTTVFVCDGSRRVREEFRRALAALPGLDRIVVLTTAESMVARWADQRPDLAMVGAKAPGIGGVETVRRVLRIDPSAKLIVLTMPDDEEAVMAAMAIGARGYLYKNASTAEVRTTVSQILSESSAIVAASPRLVPRRGRPILTERELEVLAGMCEGRSNAEIGRSLFLSEDTVKTHARRLFKKLGAADRANAVALGYRWGLVR
jgi:DNA-binding NarL/FixJ family response regulator